MAPSPEQRNEPKAPDKNNDNKSTDNAPGAENTATAGPAVALSGGASVESQEKSVSELDDGQLRDLLEEAVNYKCPKDRHGKSPLFKALLTRAEADERNQRATHASGSQLVRHHNPSCTGRSRNKHSSSSHHSSSTAAERNSHGGSLQNLYQLTTNDLVPATKNRRGSGKKGSVSTRQREGGSLPSCNIVIHDRITFDGAAKTLPLPETMQKKNSADKKTDQTVNIKPEYTAIDMSNADVEETRSLIANDMLGRSHDENADATANIEMKTIYSSLSNDIQTDKSTDDISTIAATAMIPRVPIVYTTRASLEVMPEDNDHHKVTDIDRNVTFSLLESSSNNCGKKKSASVSSGTISTTPMVNGGLGEETGGPLQLGSNYSSVKCIVGVGNDGATVNAGSTPAIKSVGTRASGSIATTKSSSTMAGILSTSAVADTQQTMNVLSLAGGGQKWLNVTTDPNRFSLFSAGKELNEKKSFDENGNVSTFNSSLSTAEYRKNKKKHRPNTDRNVIIRKAEDLIGHRGDKDVDSLVKFIENSTSSTDNKHHKNKHVVSNVAKSHKNVANFKDDEKGAKKRSSERKSKDKSVKLKKSNSLEEISKTKLEDLTDDGDNVSMRRQTAKKQATFDDAVFEDRKVGDRRSWGTEEGQQYYCNDNEIENKNKPKKDKVDKIKPPDIINTNLTELIGGASVENVTTIETAEFHVVTKKKKSKKRRSTSGGRGNLFNEDTRRNDDYYQKENYGQNKFQAHDHCDGDMVYLKTFQNSPEHSRRKSTCSMPPSDKSNDSSDLDSVHSLPVESTSTKMCLQQVSTSSGGTPQASYADITRMANVNAGTAYSHSYGVDVKNTEKWPSVSDKNSPPKNLMSAKNYNFPDLIDSCNYYNNNDNNSSAFEKIFTTVTEIEARHLNEARINYNKQNNVNNNSGNENKIVKRVKSPSGLISPPNSKIQEPYPALERTVPPPKTDTKKQQKDLGSKKQCSENIKNKNDASTANTNKVNKSSTAKNNTDSEILNSTKGCDTNKQSSINTSQESCPNSINSNVSCTNTKSKQQSVSSTVSCKAETVKHKHSSGKKQPSASSRPAVIILNDTIESGSVTNSSSASGITFGFEINEQLLSEELSDSGIQMNGDNTTDEEATRTANDASSCNDSSSTSAGEEVTIESGTSCSTPSNRDGNVASRLAKKDFSALYVEPPNYEQPQNYNHDKIVAFVGLAWEDVMKQPEGKVQYYSGQ